DVLDGHDGPVLGTGHVVDPEAVPDDDVGVLHGPVGGRVGGQTASAFAQVGVPGGASLVGREGRDPQVLGGEGGALGHGCLRLRQQHTRVAGDEAVPARLADRVEAARVHH